MGRKIKSVVMLFVVMILIYYQHVPVIYAEDGDVQDEFQEGVFQEGGEVTEEDEEKDQEQEPGEGQEEDPVIERYQLNYPQADGREGYYVTAP